jgi:hypothetical protein
VGLIRDCRCCAEPHFRNTVGIKLWTKCLLLKKLHEISLCSEEKYATTLPEKKNDRKIFIIAPWGV